MCDCSCFECSCCSPTLSPISMTVCIVWEGRVQWLDEVYVATYDKATPQRSILKQYTPTICTNAHLFQSNFRTPQHSLLCTELLQGGTAFWCVSPAQTFWRGLSASCRLNFL
jgi:hypothetical protein